MILAFHLRVAWRSLRRTPWFGLAMMTSLAVGAAMWLIARSTVVAQSAEVATGRPVYHVGFTRQLELAADTPRDFARSLREISAALLDYQDARTLLALAPGPRALSWGSRALVVPPGAGQPPRLMQLRLCTRDFFAMFGFHFRAGAPWSAGQDDDGGAAVVVLDADAARRLHAGLHDRVRVQGRELEVIGVVEPYRRLKLYDYQFLTQATPEGLYLPALEGAALELRPVIHIPALPHDPSYAALLASQDQWLHVWLELPDAAARARFLSAAEAYRAAQPARRPALTGVRLLALSEWQHVNFHVFSGYRLFYLFGGLLLVACVLNLVRLLLAKFSSRSHMIGIHRALGASRGSIFLQHLLEAELVGLGAALLGIGLSWFGFRIINLLVRERPVAFELDAAGAGLLALAALGSSALAGLYPAWRASNLAPGVFLRRA